MAGAQRAQGTERAFPILPRLVRVYGGGVQQASRAVHDCHLDAGPNAGVQAHRDALAGRRGQQQVVQVCPEDADRLGLGLLAQSLLDLDLEMYRHLELPGPSHGFEQPGVCRAVLLLDADPSRNPPLRFGGPHLALGHGQHDRQPQHLFFAPSEEGERAMRWDLPHRARWR